MRVEKKYASLLLGFSILYMWILVLPGWGEPFFLIDDRDLFLVPYLSHPWNLSSFVSLMTPGNMLDFLPLRDLSVWIDWSLTTSLPEITAVAKAQNFMWLVLSYIYLYRILAHFAKSELAAAFVASIWFLHPMHFESLQWISARKDVMAWAFILMAAYYFLLADIRSDKVNWKAVLFYLFSIYSKATFLLVAPALAIYLIWRRICGKSNYPIRTVLSCAAVSAASIFFQVWNYTSSNNMRINLSVEHKFLSMLAGLGRYLVGTVWAGANAIDVENWGAWYKYNFNYIYAGVLLLLLFAVFAFKSLKSGQEKWGMILFGVLGLLCATPGVNWMHRSFYSVRYFEPFLILGVSMGGLWFFGKTQSIRWLLSIYLVVLSVSFFDSQNWEGNGEVLAKSAHHSPQNPSVLHKKLMFDFALFTKGRMSPDEELKLREDFKHLVRTCFTDVKTECRGIYGMAYSMAGPLGYPKEQVNRLLLEGGTLQAACNRMDYPWREASDAMFTDFVFNQRQNELNKSAIVKFVSLYHSYPTMNLRSLNVLKVCFEESPEKSRELTSYYLRSYLLDNLAISEVLSEFKRDTERKEVYDCYYKPKIRIEGS